jgi:hypothetical protein
VSFALSRQGVRKRIPHRAILVADQQVDMSDFIPIARQGLANVHCHQ